MEMYNKNMTAKRFYTYQGIRYEATINYRKGKSLTLRIGQNNTLRVRVPPFCTNRTIDDFVLRNLPSLLAKIEKYDKDVEPEDYYLFGQRLPRLGLSEKEIKEYIKKELLSYLTSRTLYYEALMDIRPPYKILVRDMTTRYGVNSKTTQRITYALSLAHYSREIIDCIIVHELAHHFERNHQKAFYDVVYKYCPNYDELHEKLRKRIHG